MKCSYRCIASIELENGFNDPELQEFERKGRSSIIPTMTMWFFITVMSPFILASGSYAGEKILLGRGKESKTWIIEGKRGNAVVKSGGEVYRWTGSTLRNVKTGEKEIIRDWGNKIIIGDKSYFVHGDEERRPTRRKKPSERNIELEKKYIEFEETLEKTLKEYRQLIRDDLFNERLHKELRIYLKSVGALEKGLEIYRGWNGASFTRDSKKRKDIDAHLTYLEGMVYFELGKDSSAIEQIEHAIKDQPNKIEYWYALGLTNYVHTDRQYTWLNTALKRYFEDSLKAFGEVLKIDPNFPDVNIYRAKASIRLGILEKRDGNLHKAGEHYTLAEEALRLALKEGQKSADLHNTMGVLNQLQGKVNDAINEYKTALEIDPKYRLAKRNLEKAMKNKMYKSSFF